MAVIKKRLGEILIDSKVITEEILNKALDIQKGTGRKLGEVLVEEGFTTNEQIVNAVKNQLGIQLINLDNIHIRQEIINTIQENVARKYEVIPVDLINGQLIITMSDPLNYFAIEEIKIATGYVVKVAISLRESILTNIEKYYGKNRAEEAALDYSRTYNFQENNENNVKNVDENVAPIIKYINTIIENAILYDASDIHIEPEEKEMRVRFRVDGVLREIMKSNIQMLEPVISRIKIMAELNIAEKRIPQDGRISFKAKQKNIDIRVAIAPTIYGEKVVMRLLDKGNFTLSLEKLGLESKDYNRVKEIISKPYGIILVCGPTGSGKTTSLYSALNEVNSVEKNVITVEDPVEYNISGVNQMQVNNKIGFTFANGLRSILRQDPDIILVGEIRDNETAEIAVRAALTGHLVLSTIHTNNSASTITRLKDMGIKPFLISSTVVGIISQRLVRKICPNCIEEYIAAQREMSILEVSETVKLKRGKGCSICNHTGYKGRTAIFEVMPVDVNVKEMIDAEKNEKEIETYAIKTGMVNLRTACIKKVLDGITTVDELLRVTYGQ